MLGLPQAVAPSTGVLSPEARRGLSYPLLIRSCLFEPSTPPLSDTLTPPHYAQPVGLYSPKINGKHNLHYDP